MEAWDVRVMMTKKSKQDQAYEFVLLEELVAKDHLVRKLDKHIKFNFIYDLVEGMYSQDNGRPSIDPVVLFKMVFISYVFGIRSMRRTVKEIRHNTAYRWFLGLKLSDPVPHFTTFGKNYERRFKGTEIFQDIFDEIVRQAHDKGLIDTEAFFTDSTHLKASANKKKYVKGKIKRSIKTYQKALDKEIDEERERLGKKAFERKDDDDDEPPKTGRISKTDPESGFLHRKGKPQGFFYLDHRTVDGKHNIIVDSHITPGNVHDSIPYTERMDRIERTFGFVPKKVALDSGYMAKHIAKYLSEKHIDHVFGYRRFGRRKPGRFRRKDYIYVAMHDYYVCPNKQPLHYKNIRRNGDKEYRAEAGVCKRCRYKNQCLSPKAHTKIITRHLWEDHMDQAKRYKRTEEGKALYRKRAETVERSFADAKELHALRYARYRGIKKVTMQSLLTSACQNMKKIALMMDRLALIRRFKRLFSVISPKFSTI